MAVIPEFHEIIKEIERSYVLGNLFSALSAACVSMERVLNLARIKLHKHHSKIKTLWGKGPTDNWGKNIDALREWGYLEQAFAEELQAIFKEVRCKYLHSAPVADLRRDALRSVNAAYRLLTIFLGFPEDIFQLTDSIVCTNTSDPRFVEFYLPELHAAS